MSYLIAAVLMVLADLVTKRLAIAYLQPVASVPVIENVFHLTYVQNEGASFGILPGKTTFFIVVVSLAVLFLLWLLLFGKARGRLYRFSLAMVIAGGIGNLIDRIRFGYVVDLFDFRLIDFPVFNVADICVVVGVILLFFVLLLGREHGKRAAQEEAVAGAADESGEMERQRAAEQDAGERSQSAGDADDAPQGAGADAAAGEERKRP